MPADGRPLHVLGIPGSLRKGSYNRAVLRAIEECAPEGMSIEPFELTDVPLYNADVEADGDPPGVVAMKEAIRNADALLFVTPEYQHGIPGVLKNAIDWASRGDDSPLEHKVAAVMGASPGYGGTARAQEQLRQSLTYNEVYIVPGPEVLIRRVRDKIDDDGRFEDESAVPFIRKLLENLAFLTIALRDARPASGD